MEFNGLPYVAVIQIQSSAAPTRHLTLHWRDTTHGRCDEMSTKLGNINFQVSWQELFTLWSSELWHPVILYMDTSVLRQDVRPKHWYPPGLYGVTNGKITYHYYLQSPISGTCYSLAGKIQTSKCVKWYLCDARGQGLFYHYEHLQVSELTY